MGPQMSEAWYYREGPDQPERGPVSDADLQYLRSTGKIHQGMEVRQAYGDWQPVSGKGCTDSKGSDLPVSHPSRGSIEPVSLADPSPKLTRKVSAPPPPPSGGDSKHRKWPPRLVPTVVVVFGLLVLIILLLNLNLLRDAAGLAVNGQSSEGDDAGQQNGDSGDAGSKPVTKRLASDKSGPASNSSQRTTAPSQAKVSGGANGAPGNQRSGEGSGDNALVDVGDKPPPDSEVPEQYFISSGAEFFGVRSSGRRFVFLIDSSTSMDGGGAAAARRELIDSIRRMNADMELEVIFFTNQLTPVFNGYQSLEKLEPVVEKVRTARPFTGGTPVMPGIRRAVNMKPDAIFLLTDGAFDEGDVTSQVGPINPTRIPINTIGFQDRSTERALRNLASSTGGDYKYVAN